MSLKKRLDKIEEVLGVNETMNEIELDGQVYRFSGPITNIVKDLYLEEQRINGTEKL